MGLLEPHVGHCGRHREAGLSAPQKAITFHSLRQARAAAAAAGKAGVPVLLLSAPSAAAAVGPAWFCAVATSVAAAFSDVPLQWALDCGSLPGHALAALRHGVKTIRYDGPSFDTITEIARQTGAEVIRQRPDTLDLGSLRDADDNPRACAAYADACRRWLQAGTTGG